MELVEVLQNIQATRKEREQRIQDLRKVTEDLVPDEGSYKLELGEKEQMLYYLVMKQMGVIEQIATENQLLLLWIASQMPESSAQ